MLTLKIKLFFFLLLCISVNSFSQITITPNVGCAPLNGVSFSGPAGATNITWNFGDAVMSNQAAPTHNYTSSGNYTVTYNATVGASPVSFTALVVVHAKPTASFTFTVPAIRCKPLNVPFTSTSSGPAAITSYTWNFGDGGQSNNGLPVWIYNLQGSFFPTLLVTDANGCVSAVSSPQGPINVSNPPTVIINSNPLSLTSCTAPFAPAFSASNCVSGSPIPGPLASYSWNFGNTQTSTQQTPGTINYSTPGVYNVSLTVTDNNNCSATGLTQVNVSQPTLTAIVPGTVCVNTSFTVGYSSNGPNINTYWNFGSNLTFSTLSTGTAVTTSSIIIGGYSAPGIYTITASAGSFPCTAVQTKTIFVEQVVPNFTLTPPSLTCSPTFTASYINTSSPNAVTYTWTTNNGAAVVTSNLTNPTFTFTQGSLNPYTIYQPFTPTVTLMATSANGCVGTVTHIYDTIRRPTAWFNKDKKEGCAPLAVKFRDSSFTYNPLYAITNYTWNNGANPATTVIGTIPPPMINPTFTYNTAGTYTPFLIVQTAQGCIDISFIDTVTVVNPPTFNIAVTPSVVCWNQPVTVNITSTSTNPVQHWHVNSDNGFFSHCINNPNPSWNFTHVGTHTFSIDGYSHSCKNTIAATQSVTVKGPIVTGRFETNCNPATRKVIKFYSYLQDAASATLNFGDGSPVANITGNPGGNASSVLSHTYVTTPSIQDFTVTLTGINGSTGCSPNTYTMLVKVRDIQATFTYSNLACAGVTQTYNAVGSQDVYLGCKRGYVWSFDNGPTIDTILPVFTHAFSSVGIHTVTLWVKDENSCVDTAVRTIRVSNANPTFTFSSNPICLSSGTVQMINTTLQPPSVIDAVNDFTWDFGDGSPLLQTTTPTSPTHTYLSATSPSQVYNVQVTATNALGCTSSTTMPLTVVNPLASITPDHYFLCIPSSTANLATNTVTFTAPPAYNSYTFTYGDGNPSVVTTTNVTQHTYGADGTYTASIIVDIGGCKNSNSVTVKVETYPIPNFSFAPGSICRGEQIQFTNTSTGSAPFTPTWNLGSNAPIVPSNTVAWTYNSTGTVAISLTVTTNQNQCKASITKVLDIFGVKATPILDKNTVCLGNPIKFHIKNDSSTVESWDWDFGDGSTSSFNANAAPSPTVIHTYTYYPLPNGNTFISFTGWSSQHKCYDNTKVPIQIIKIDGDFKRNNEVTLPDYNHCIGVIDQFSNQTPNSTGYTFSWNFGDGTGTGTGQNPSYTYPQAGVYTVTLNILDPVNNCQGLATKNMTINPLPVAGIVSPGSICQNAPFVLTSTTSVGVPVFTYTWNPSPGLTTPNNYSTTATASNSATYTLLIQDGNGCKNTTTASVYIQLPPASFQWDTVIVIGQPAFLNNNSGSNFTYTWSPPTGLSCTNCPNPIVNTLVNMVYTVTIADNLGCFRIQNTHTVEIVEKSSVDVPTAFTPNGDGTNDVIYVDGWGIKKLNYFRVFNRWGQLLFESTDIKIGWDGMFNSVPQNMETYVYQVSVETYIDKEALLKTGTFKLIR